MSTRVRYWLPKCGALLVVGICLAYLAREFDPTRFLEVFAAHSLFEYVLACAIFAVIMLPMGIRLHLIMNGECSFADALRAAFIGAGVNNLLPARLGDVAKAAFLSRSSGIPAARTLCTVFWERLADLCTILLLALLLGLRFRAEFVTLSLALGIAAIISGLFLVCRYPQWFFGIIAYIPLLRVRHLLSGLLEQLSDRKQWPGWMRLLALSLLVWLSFSAFNTFFLSYFFGLPLDFWNGMLVGVAGAIGMLVPAMPANIGTFEASLVVALMLTGQDKSTALAAALLLHLVQMLPATLYAVLAFMRKENLFWSLRNQAE